MPDNGLYNLIVVNSKDRNKGVSGNIAIFA